MSDHVTERAMTNLRRTVAQAWLASAQPLQSVDLVLAPGKRVTYVLATNGTETFYKLAKQPSGTGAPSQVAVDRMRAAMVKLSNGEPLAVAF